MRKRCQNICIRQATEVFGCPSCVPVAQGALANPSAPITLQHRLPKSVWTSDIILITCVVLYSNLQVCMLPLLLQL